MSRTVEEAQRVAQLLNGAELPQLRAGVDPAWAETNRPCVLVAPPALDFTANAYRHRLVCLSSKKAGDLTALEQLGELVDAVDQAMPGYIERAEPTSYQLTGGEAGVVPAYVLTITT